MGVGDLLRKVVFPSFVIAVTLWMTSCPRHENRAILRQETNRKRVRVARARMQSVQPVLETFGTLVYRSKADIYPGLDGVIEQVLVEEGYAVSRGEILALFSKDRFLTSREQMEAELASQQARVALAEERLREGRKSVEASLLRIQKAEADLAQAQVRFETISQSYDNKKRLFDAGGVSEGELQSVHTRYVAAQMELAGAEKDLQIRRIGFRDEDILAAGFTVPDDEKRRDEIITEINTGMLSAELRVARAELQAARAEFRRIELMLDETVIRSPIDGIVGMRFAEIGEKADRDTLLFTLFDTSALYAQAEISETDLRRLTVKQEAELSFEGGGQSRIPGRVELISPYINPKTRTARVRIGIPNPHGAYIPGMFVRIRIFTGEAERRVTLPYRAVSTDPELLSEGQAAVFLVRNARLFRTRVILGQRLEEGVVVLQGVEAGEMVVLDLSPDLSDGMEVEIQP